MCETVHSIKDQIFCLLLKSDKKSLFWITFKISPHDREHAGERGSPSTVLTYCHSLSPALCSLGSWVPLCTWHVFPKNLEIQTHGWPYDYQPHKGTCVAATPQWLSLYNYLFTFSTSERDTEGKRKRKKGEEKEHPRSWQSCVLQPVTMTGACVYFFKNTNKHFLDFDH